MIVNESITKEILFWITEKDHFKELSLTPDGTLFVDPARETKVDEFWIYSQKVVYLPGSLYVNYNGEFHTFGAPLDKELRIKLMKNKTVIQPLKDGGCGLDSRRAGIPSGSTLIAFFRYRGKAVFIIAGDVVSRRSLTVILEATAENDAMLLSSFKHYLQRADSEVAELLASSQLALVTPQPLQSSVFINCV